MKMSAPFNVHDLKNLKRLSLAPLVVLWYDFPYAVHTSTKVSKLPTFIFCMEIYSNLQSHNKSIFKFTKTLLYVNISMQK
jgi:hypothetical protein